MQLVHDLGDAQELRHRAERLTAEIGIGAGEDHAAAAQREVARDLHDAGVEELHLVDRNDLRERIEPERDLARRVHRHRLDGPAVVTADGEDAAGISVIKVRLEHLHPLLRDHRPAHATDELFALAAEHHAGDDLYPATRQLERSGHLSTLGRTAATIITTGTARLVTTGRERLATAWCATRLVVTCAV